MLKGVVGVCLLLLLTFNAQAETKRSLFNRLCEYELCKVNSYHGGVFNKRRVGAETLYSLMEMDRPGGLKRGMNKLSRFNKLLPGKKLIQIAIVTKMKQCRKVEKEFDELMATGNYPSMCLVTFPLECS